ncbi:MAG: alpha/beta hydrolase [Nitrososphaeraceae archaeon]
MSKHVIKNLTYAIAILTLATSITTSSLSLPFLSSTNDNSIISTYAYSEDNSGGDNGNTTDISNNATRLNSLLSETSTDLPNIDTKKIKVGDIDIAYKIFGNGDPLLLIPGFSQTMDMWGDNVLSGLSANNTLIIFDNRGMGLTTSGNGTAFTIEQFTNDTAALIDALKIGQPVDVLGLSLGGFIAQDLALLHPEKVNRLILVASSCGGNQSIPPQVSPQDFKSMVSGNATKEVFLHTLFPQDWIQNNTEYIENEFIFPMGQVSAENLQLQSAAAGRWDSCERLSDISRPTLVLTGAQDITSPPMNSIVLAKEIPGAWLVQIGGGGHGLMFQYPDKFAKVLETFLAAT